MSLSELTNHIVADAQKRAEKIESDALLYVREKSIALEREHKATQAQAEDSTRLLLEENNRRIIASAEHENNIADEVARRTLLDETFDELTRHISALSDSEYETFFAQFIPTAIPLQPYTLYVQKERVDVTKKILAAHSIIPENIVTEDVINDGFVLVGKTQDIDVSLPSLIETIRARYEVMISRALFNLHA